jgi:hypothetical protein
MMKRSRAKSTNEPRVVWFFGPQAEMSGVLAFERPAKVACSVSSPPSERPHPHAFSPAIPATAYLGIPADSEFIKAVMRGILATISAEAEESLGSVAQ